MCFASGMFHYMYLKTWLCFPIIQIKDETIRYHTSMCYWRIKTVIMVRRRSFYWTLWNISAGHHHFILIEMPKDDSTSHVERKKMDSLLRDGTFNHQYEMGCYIEQYKDRLFLLHMSMLSSAPWWSPQSMSGTLVSFQATCLLKRDFFVFYQKQTVKDKKTKALQWWNPCLWNWIGLNDTNHGSNCFHWEDCFSIRQWWV